MAGIWVRGQQLKDVKQAERLKLDSLKVQECRSTKARQFLLMIFVQKFYQSSTNLLTRTQWFKPKGPKMWEEKDHLSLGGTMHLCFGFHSNV